ncbi:hypothetical protein C8Q73DRAFT_159665 [Cubamyces lactineus]|nr:hypothetical protein C8Q73DRAFT_159665 [Cubamyces lactineus]
MDQELLATRLDFDIFMHELVKPVAGEPEDVFFDNLFDSVPTNGCESAIYEAFADAINTRAVLSGSLLVATHSTHDNRDATENKAGCGMYSAGSSAVIDRRTDWSTIEVSIECETGYADDPDAGVVEEVASYPIPGRSRKGLIAQITTTSSIVFKYQLVTHHFTLLLLGEYVRVAMSDRAGIIYSSQINYKANPAKLGRVFWRLSHASPEARGHDPSAVRIHRDSPEYDAMVAWKTKILPVDDHAREVFVETLREDYPWYKLTVGCEDGPRDFLVAKPTYVAPELLGRGTHGFVAYNVGDPKRPFAYLKDYWRVVGKRLKPEGEILAYLNSKRVKNIPPLLCHGDVLGQKTVAQEIWQLANGNPERECQMKEHRHYRIVVKEVGKPIYEFSNGKQLVKILSDCVLAHKEAYKKAKVIHRDVSVGNMIMIPVDKSPQGTVIYRGLLTDWEISKEINEYDLEPRHPDRTGTWQYLSVNALNNPTKHVDVADDLESFLYVLVWCAIRYLPHNCPDVGHFMYYFFDHGETTNHKEYTCGLLKRLAISEGYLMTNTQKPVTFLREPLPTSVDPSVARDDSTPLPPVPTQTLHKRQLPSPSPSNTIELSLSTGISQEQEHPIHHIVTVLLRRFGRYYKAQEFSSVASVNPKKIAAVSGFDGSAYYLAEFDTDSGSDSNSGSGSNSDTEPGWDLSDDHSLASAYNRKKIAKRANSHRMFGNLLVDSIRDKNAKWPLNDRLADQLDLNCSPDKEDKPRGKRPRDEEKPAESDSKGLRSDTS